MSILVNKDSKVICQGITGKAGLFHTIQCRDYGTNIVGGVTPKKGGTTVEGFPVFNSCKEIVAETGADTTMIFVPPPFTGGAIIEAAEAGIKIIVAITEGVPVMDMIKVKKALEGMDVILCGPNCPGLVTPGEAKVGIAPGFIHQRGKIGVLSRSGTLTYEAVYQTTKNGLGQTSAVGIGGDSIHGLTHTDVVKMYNEDPETEGIILIGEIGGSEEEEAAAYIKENVDKPVAAFIAGATAPKGKRMGHAGAIIEGNSGTAASKIQALKDAGVVIAPTAAEIGEKMLEAISLKK
ncbi:MAG: succinate--CoA ligase subunit alpha [Desulfobacterales bacterium]|nr:succinate--CoA ligase subunit alpha [Desulfobacterales bacterium]